MASSPPAEAPIATMVNGLSAFGPLRAGADFFGGFLSALFCFALPFSPVGFTATGDCIEIFFAGMDFFYFLRDLYSFSQALFRKKQLGFISLPMPVNKLFYGMFDKVKHKHTAEAGSKIPVNQK